MLKPNVAVQESDLSSLLSVRETAQTNTQTNAQAVLDLDPVCMLVHSVPPQRLLMHYGPLVDRLACRETDRQTPRLLFWSYMQTENGSVPQPGHQESI